MKIGAYQVLFELGHGGMGTVYLARNVGPRGIERLVAIKRPHQQFSAQSDQRFLDEARITAHVHHANVAGMHQAGSDDQGHYLVFDYVEGESLERLVARASERNELVPPRVVLRVVLDALAGLHAAHETRDAAGQPLGILHRDVSVHNLLVGRDGVTRLTDFGIAKSVQSSAVTEQGYVQGRLVYMAPEYLQKLPVDRTLDIYSMGVTLWVALRGGEPWPDAHPAQVMQKVLMDGVPSLSSLGVDVAPELEAIVVRACCRDAGLRFQNARQMLDELDAVGKKLDAIASHVEVAEYMERMAGSELAARREAIKNCRQTLALETVSAETEPSTLSAHATGVDEPTQTSALISTWEKPLPWRAAMVGAVTLALIAIGVAVFSSRDSGERSAPFESAASAASTLSGLPAASLTVERALTENKTETEPTAPMIDAAASSSVAPAASERPAPSHRRARSVPRSARPPDRVSKKNPYR